MRNLQKGQYILNNHRPENIPPNNVTRVRSLLCYISVKQLLLPVSAEFTTTAAVG